MKSKRDGQYFCASGSLGAEKKKRARRWKAAGFNYKNLHENCRVRQRTEGQRKKGSFAHEYFHLVANHVMDRRTSHGRACRTVTLPTAILAVDSPRRLTETSTFTGKAYNLL